MTASPEISLLLPTHRHPGLMKRLLNSIVRTTAVLSRLEIVLYLDDDDTETLRIESPGRELRLVKLIKRPDAMGNIMRACYDASHGKYVLLLNDDMIFGTKDWDTRVLREFAAFPDGIAMVYGNDLYYGDLMCTFPILTRTVCELMGGVCPSEYRWHCIDAHLLDLFKRLTDLGYPRSVYLKDVIFEHMHHELSAAINDDSDLKPDRDIDDQVVYFSLADRRQMLAQKMADRIVSHRAASFPLKAL